MSLTLFINKSDSHCECSGLEVDNRALTCPHCGGTWDTISSDYSGMGTLVAPMRPDLTPHFPWEGWWLSDAGKKAQQELRELDT